MQIMSALLKPTAVSTITADANPVQPLLPMPTEHALFKDVFLIMRMGAQLANQNLFWISSSASFLFAEHFRKNSFALNVFRDTS